MSVALGNQEHSSRQTKNPSTKEAEAGGSQVPDQTGPYIQALSQNMKTKKHNYKKISRAG
jgi:hypothetical protein